MSIRTEYLDKTNRLEVGTQKQNDGKISHDMGPFRFRGALKGSEAWRYHENTNVKGLVWRWMA
ncbi:predicted protein [Sclerotinia sclerotiorum 1980 UF-70]|uniref:Uncharacterized protein n=1 Tax=Sclerotinia sclerotiorum (strain ATCC 18683 / 1980 / Ss-1) TaxID=665079 RepID=A7EE87_SCLS1|nr:predicted protein [Sclerotinia sclerotiorum 1980 UF-70]EDO01153.1 predicted protein [Sclerotinia sclerotiorum 1980 UF-70]